MKKPISPYKTTQFPKFKLFFFTLVFSLLAASCSDDNQKGSNRGSGKFAGQGKKPTKVTPVAVQKPRQGLAASYYITTATLEPNSDAKINSRANGVVRKLFHEEGDDVSQGDILLQLEDDDQKLRLKQAQQTLASAKREYQRLNKMKKAGVVSPTEWEATDNTYKIAQTEKKLAELNLSYTQVAAPFSGRVVWREVDLGEHVSQGELLFRMMSIEPLLVRVHIPSNRLGQVAKGQTVEIILDNLNAPLLGKIHLVSPIVDPNTGTLKVTIKLIEYPNQVRPGDFSEVHMVTDKHDNALLVPSTSIIEERGQNFVYIVKQSNAKISKAKKIKVEVGFAMATETEIISGLKANDQVVVKGQRSLNDNVSVEILSDSKKNISQQKTNGTNQKRVSKRGKNNSGSNQ